MKKLLSLIALAGIFAACQPEEIQTAFEVSDAVATINVKVIDIRTNAEVTPDAVTASVGEYANGVVTIKGNPTIAKQTVTVRASYKASYMETAGVYSSDVEVLALRAGGVASYDVLIIAGELSPVPGYTYKMVKENEKSVTDLAYFTPSTGSLIDYEDKMWAQNNSELILTGTVTWKSMAGTVISNYNWKGEAADEELKPYAESYRDALNTGITEKDEDPYQITVSAFSYYTVYVTRVITTANCTVYKVNVDTKAETAIATFDVKSVVANKIEYEEMADPNSHGHYERGQGHGQGGDNAGGGIVYSE